MFKKLLPALFISLVVLTGCTSITSLKFNTNTDENYDFIYDTIDDPYLVKLRTEFDLDTIITGCTSDLEKIRALSAWVQNLWEHDGSNMPEKSDPISILHEVQNGSRFRCVEYAIVLNGCLNAVGITSRTLALKTKDVETRESGAGHVVLEAYSKDLDKWIMVDSQWDVIPVLNGTPLNAVEFQEALVKNRYDLIILTASDLSNSYYYKWIGEYLFYFDVLLDNRVVNRTSAMSLMLVSVGEKNPTVFQREWPIEDMIYTHSVNAFYTEP